MKVYAFLFFSVICSPLHAQYTLTPGKSDNPPNIKSKVPKPFKYEPINPEFFQSIEDALSDKDFSQAIEMATEVIEEEKEGTDEREEAHYALGLTLSRIGLTYGASRILKSLAHRRIGTTIGSASLYQLNLIAQNGLYARDEMELISTNEFGTLHPHIQSFVSYHLGMYNLVQGFKNWANKEFRKIKANSYWGQQKRYLTALGEVARNRRQSAYKILKAQYESPTTHERIKQKVIIQLARILFEKKEFHKAFEFYNEAKPPLREEGRLLLEKAWTLYYLKNFSKALGLLAALEVPYYRRSIDPEMHVLKMLMYKQLCHYKTVQSEVKKFHEVFNPALKDIKMRKPLRKNPLIASHALLPYKEQEKANFIHLLRTERQALQKWRDYPFYANLIQDYNNKEKQVIQELEEKIERNAKKSAKHFLEIKEEIEFLSYSTNLDQLRIVKRGENRSYKSERISPITFNSIFWPISTEYWKDEFQDYKVLINSRCDNKEEGTIKEA